MTINKQRTRAFVTTGIQPGDIVLTTSSHLTSRAIQKGIRADISHAMLCVTNGSVIDSTPEGVHARNLNRIVLEPGCSAYVLRPREPLSREQLAKVIAYARAMIGTRYSVKDALKSVAAKVAPGRRQFCSRLVAQAYECAGVKLSKSPAFCTPGDLVRCQLLKLVPNVFFELSADQEAIRRQEDPVQEMRDVTNVLLDGARQVAPGIESLTDIDWHLRENPGDDARMVEALHASGYLILWKTQVANTPWVYDIDLLEAGDAPESYTQNYCADVFMEEVHSPKDYAAMRGVYMGYHMVLPLEYFRLQTELYTSLAKNHSRRLQTAITWLERRGLLTRESTEYLVPHTLEWYLSLAVWDPRLSLKVSRAVQAAGENTGICTLCTKESTRDYAAITPPPAGPGTYRLCDACYQSHSILERLKPFSE